MTTIAGHIGIVELWHRHPACARMARPVLRLTAFAVLAGTLPGCTHLRDGDAVAVGNAWQRSRAQPEAPLPRQQPSGSEALIRVNGAPIQREQVSRLLWAGRGLDVMDELIVLELARAKAQEQGLSVSRRDLDAERDLALRSLISPLPSATPDAFDREAAERVLNNILAGRGISQEEYRLGLERNAYLRKLAAATLEIGEADLRAEYARAYGQRVRVRHIQLLNTADVAEVRRQLDAGVDFAELARRYSANASTAPGGGLMAPFARDDPAVPALLREAAFRLAPGQVSNAIRIDNWLHLLKVEEQLPANNVPFEQVRDELTARVRDRLINAEMQRTSAELFNQADVQIVDSELRKAFNQRHPALQTQGGGR